MNIVSRNNPLKHYLWGNQCDGWNLVDEQTLSVKLEHMPPHTEEALHVHQQAQQFFFILNGEAAFEVDGTINIIKAEEGIHILPGESHRIINQSADALHFILCSQPATTHDRKNLL
jgi:mannose-6-phosphate isomerase-like protein (cupin superfamily)